MEYRTLNNGVKIPYVGFGTWTLDDETVIPVLLDAFKLGYRRIDTARYYDNEIGIGKAIKQSNIPREEFFVTSKVWHEDAGYQGTLDSYNASLKDLDLEYIDLFLIHWPTEKDAGTWKAMEELYEAGKVRAIGVSNYEQRHLDELLKVAKVIPMVNQVERHPLNNRNNLVEYFSKYNIALEATSPLARKAILDSKVLDDLATEYNVSVSQIVLRWHYQSDFITFPKSANIERMKQNINIFDFSLEDSDMKLIDSLNTNTRISGYPDFYDNEGFKLI